MYDVIIIGAGPAGLTAAYELSKHQKKVLILEKKENVGGLAETKVFDSYRYDIGPHRFFTKNKEVYQIFLDILGEDAVEVNRKTRILFKNKYFDYPLTPINALFGLGFIEATRIIISYIFSRSKDYLGISKVNNFEDWVINKFGRRLYKNFFKNYTEKVWGIDCKDIGADWAEQRIKGLSLSAAIKFALFPNSKSRPKSLVDKFYYPKYGAGMIWEKLESYLLSKQVEILKNSNVTDISWTDGEVNIKYIDSENNINTVSAKNLFFSNPLLQFIQISNNEVPDSVQIAANELRYRNHISVHVTIDQKLFDDNWIYIHSPDLKMARIADFTNFSKFMAPDNLYPLTLEYFCYENEEFWKKNNDEIIKFGIYELKKIFKADFNVVHAEVTRNKAAYPVIQTGFEEKINIIRTWISSINNITAIGRSGMFKYNNQDHAMATGLYASRNLLGLGDYDPWDVNVDGEYHEEVK